MVTCQKYSWTPRVGRRKRWEWDRAERLPELDLNEERSMFCWFKAMKQSTENQFDSYLMVSNSHSAHCLLCFIRQIFCHFSSKAKKLIWTFRPFWFWHNHEVPGRCSWAWVRAVSVTHMGKRTRGEKKGNKNTLQCWKIILPSFIQLGLSSFITPCRLQLPAFRDQLNVWLKHLKGSEVPQVRTWH